MTRYIVTIDVSEEAMKKEYEAIGGPTMTLEQMITNEIELHNMMSVAKIAQDFTNEQ